MINALAIDTSALDLLQPGLDFRPEWFRDWSGEILPLQVKRVELDGIVYFIGPKAESNSKILVIDLKNSGLFENLESKLKPEAFLRLIRIGRSAHSPGTLPHPTSWAAFHSGSLVSIRSNHAASGERSRIEIDLHPRKTHHTFVYMLGQNNKDLSTSVINYDLFDKAVSMFDDAIIATLEQEPSSNLTRVELTELGDRITLGKSLDDWINGYLNKSQQDFVFAPLNSSIRLVGAAGTGKTLALVVKCLHEFQKSGIRSANFRCLFLTHNQSTVESVNQAINSMDHNGIISSYSNSLLKICTLQELANESMKYDLYGLEPLSNDGLEGRSMQIEAIEAQIELFVKSDWITYRNRCSANFCHGIEAKKGSNEAKFFASELMNEFACVLEADGVRQSADRRERYCQEHRKAWMMPLPTADDRRVVLWLYDKFREFLRSMNVIGLDQMIADYLGFLDSNRWDNTREREGFDVVFVDELHLFNRQERMTLHQLMRSSSKLPIIIMAYDVKQSIRDNFNGSSQSLSDDKGFPKNLGLGQTERFELKEGFRYTTEIAQVLESIDQTFPAAGISEELGEDWKPTHFSGTKNQGIRPVLVTATSSLEIFDTVFPRANRMAKKLQKGSRVAVLCASDTLFKKYAESGKYKDHFIAITDREQLSNLRHAGKRFVFSMPEFVAGMQFDTVYLIEVNEGEVDQGPYATGAKRRFVSLVYLGASRAEKVLELYSSAERGGTSKILKIAVDSCALDVIKIKDLD